MLRLFWFRVNFVAEWGCRINAEDMTDHILNFLRSIHDDGWDEGLDAVLTGIAEVEGAEHQYDDDQVTKLANKLIAELKFCRKAFKAGRN